jgi:hypothetical protein
MCDGRLFILCWDCLEQGNAIFRHALPTDRIQVALDVKDCRYREAQEALLHSNPFHIAELVDDRHRKLLQAGKGRLAMRIDAF